MSPCSRKAREYGLKLLFLKTEVEKSGNIITATSPSMHAYPLTIAKANCIINVSQGKCILPQNEKTSS